MIKCFVVVKGVECSFGGTQKTKNGRNSIAMESVNWSVIPNESMYSVEISVKENFFSKILAAKNSSYFSFSDARIADSFG